MWVDENETVYIFLSEIGHQQKVRTGSKVAGREKKKYNIILQKRGKLIRLRHVF